METLVEAVREQMGTEDDYDEFRDTMSDVAQGGAEAGFGGFTYTNDCVDFYEANKDAIWELLREDACQMGYDNATALIGSFNRADMAEDPDGLANLLAWYALEFVARHVSDQ